MEGETDKRVIPYLMEENGVAWPRPPNHPVDIEAYGSVDNILKPGVIEAEIGASGLEALGVVVDANGDAARWKRVSTWCGSEFSELPDRIPAEGLEVVHSRGPRFGVWIMPDNRFTGMLEDFLVQLIPDDSRDLYGLAPELRCRGETQRSSVQEGSQDESRDSHVARVAGSAGSATARSREEYGSGPCQNRITTLRRLVQGALSRVEFHRDGGVGRQHNER